MFPMTRTRSTHKKKNSLTYKHTQKKFVAYITGTDDLRMNTPYFVF